jgi:catalase
MRFDGNRGSAVNYQRTSFGGPTQGAKYTERPKMISGTVPRHDHRSDADYYTQPGNLFRLMLADAKQRLINNIVGNQGQTPKRIQELQFQHFYKAIRHTEPAWRKGWGWTSTLSSERRNRSAQRIEKKPLTNSGQERPEYAQPA